MTQPNIDQLYNLTDRAATGLTVDEQQRLRAGIDQLAGTLRAALDAIDESELRGPARTDYDRWRAALAGEQPAPAATQATELETTARVFAGLHQSAEQDVTRVINLYEQWVKAGPPPLGTPVSRWWDKRLAELHAALNPKEN